MPNKSIEEIQAQMMADSVLSEECLDKRQEIMKSVFRQINFKMMVRGAVVMILGLTGAVVTVYTTVWWVMPLSLIPCGMFMGLAFSMSHSTEYKDEVDRQFNEWLRGGCK